MRNLENSFKGLIAKQIIQTLKKAIHTKLLKFKANVVYLINKIKSQSCYDENLDETAIFFYASFLVFILIVVREKYLIIH